MNELEGILNYLETTSLEPHDDYTSEFSYKEQKMLWKYIKELQQENEELKEAIKKAIDKLQLLIDIGFDYDGFNESDSLKTLIDELVGYAKESKNILKEAE